VIDAGALERLTIAEAGARLRAGSLTSVALTRACLDRIEALDPALNAFITVTADEALADAAAADAASARGEWRGPLHGVPISLKDIIDQRGVVTTAASRVARAEPAAADAVVTANLRMAGAVLVGKCNLHEYALGTTTEESAFGPARHPLDPSRSPGGSSGGSAIAVATGMSLGSVGTDTGGSVRIPSAACGLVGLKAGLGEVPCDGVVLLSPTCDHVGPLAKTVTDAALLFAGLTGTAPVDLGEPADVAGRRFGVPRDYFQDRLEPDVRAAFEGACGRLGEAGAILTEVEIPWVNLAPSIYITIVLAEAAALHARLLETSADAYCRGVRLRLEAGRYVLAGDYLRAREGRTALARSVDRALAGCEALLTPTLPIVAPRLGTTSVAFDGVSEPLRNVMLRLTQPFNLSGHPACTLPCGADRDGLPCALQMVGHRHGTTELLRLARACEPYVVVGPMRGGTG
jgi:aspartyl-tRNA(Asn)/glutamyl-tRNA(Gln) amidotransferase subunit A